MGRSFEKLRRRRCCRGGAGSKSLDVISQLLDAGVDVNRRNVLGMNALLLVAGYADERLVQLVLDAGADPTSANDFGHTALHLAIVGKRSQLKVQAGSNNFQCFATQ